MFSSAGSGAWGLSDGHSVLFRLLPTLLTLPLTQILPGTHAAVASITRTLRRHDGDNDDDDGDNDDDDDGL